MKNLSLVDLAVIAAYLVAMVLVGVYFSRKNKNADQFTKASGLIPGWATGRPIALNLTRLSFYGVN